MRHLFLLFLALFLSLSVGVAQQSERSASRVTIAGESFYVHTVQGGETFYSLSKLYGVDEQILRERNPMIVDGLQTGTVLKIPVLRSSSQQKESVSRRESRRFDTHTVNQGETAYAISKRYEIPLAILMEDNPGFDPAHLAIGQQVKIRVASQGTSDVKQIDKEITHYTETLNTVSPQFSHHVVAKGETLYSLSKTTGLPIDTIAKYNVQELKEGLKLGSILRFPLPADRAASTTQAVKSATTGRVSNVTTQEQNGPAFRGVGVPASELNSTGVSGSVIPAATEDPSSVLTNPASSTNSSLRTEAVIKDIDMTAPIRVAVLLPIRVGNSSDRRYLEFYQGVLVALEELKDTGVSSQVDLFNTARSESEVRTLLSEPQIRQSDLIIGPVYDECFAPVASYAAREGIPIVSPLAAVEHADLPVVFEVAPPQATKADKLKEELRESNNVVAISASSTDAELQREISALLPSAARKVTFARGGGASQVEGWIDQDRANTFVVLSQNEQATEEILASLSSVLNARLSRGQNVPAVKVIGSSRWARFLNIDKNLFFKLNVRYMTFYHADRGNERVADFDRRYVAAFSSLPSVYAYRGYDVAKLFVSAIKLHGNEFASYINEKELPLLQTPYRFTQRSGEGRYSNREWSKVCYNSNYTIEVQ